MTELVNTGKNGVNSDCVLHTDPDCMFVTPKSTPAEEAPVDPDELRECLWCAGTVERVQGTEFKCPFCEEQIKDLPSHLPCEESP